MIQEKKKHKKSKKKPSAMAQVHNKVNAGVMDGVVYGGMMEAAEPEDEEYEIGLEDGGLESYGHAVDESTDCVKFADHYYDCYYSNAVAFMSLIRKDGNKGRIFVAPPGNLHGNLKAYLIGNKEINPEEYGRPSELKSDEKRTGRFWFGDGCNIISFYWYPESTKQIYNNCVEALLAIKEKTGEDFNIGEVMVDLWTKSIRNPIIMPVRWFNNGMADTFLPIAKKCEPYEDFDGSFRYRISTSKGIFTADWKGDDIEQEENYYMGENKKTMYITEEQARQMKILLENEGTNIKKARRYLESKGYSPENRQNILNSIRNDIPNSRLQQCKFLLGVTRLYLDGELDNAQSIFNLNKTLKYLATDAHVNEYDFNLNGEHLDTLVNRFSGVAKSDLEKNKAASNARQLNVNSNYTIVPIDSAEEAAKYGDYTSWCVTHDPNMYNSYTNNGLGRFYFCLREGFQNEPKEMGENCPLDSYGLSMIAVSVTKDGDVNTITCRWNHDNGGNDNILTVEQLENIIGRNFYQTFLPFTEDELYERTGYMSCERAQQLLDSGKKLNELFTYIRKCKGAVLVGFVLRSNSYSDYGEDDEEYGEEEKYLYNFVAENNKLLSEKWFTFVTSFKKLVPRENSFEIHSSFIVQLENNKFNVFNTDGHFLSKIWFDSVRFLTNGFAIVLLNSKANYINTNGDLLSNTWFDGCYEFTDNGYGIVSQKRDKVSYEKNVIDGTGRLLLPAWYDEVEIGTTDLIKVGREIHKSLTWTDVSYNFVDVKRGGEPISDIWFDSAKNFVEGSDYTYVGVEGKKCVLYRDGKVFMDGKLITKEMLEQEYAAPINESVKKQKGVDYQKYVKSLINFMREQHLHIDPLPSIELNPEEQDGIFVKTGYYSPDEQKVVVFTDGRHPKDILRTVAHEFVHHMQNLQNPHKDWGGGGDLEEDSKLRSIEGEAFLLGNIIFREWTEKMKKTKELNETKKRKKQVKNDKGELVPETCDKCGGKVVCQIHGEPVYVCKDCGKYFGTMPCKLNESINIKKALKYLKNRRDPDNIENWDRLDEIESEIVEPDDVDLSSFNIKKHLNPKFWDDGHLDTRIRLKLLDIADDFFDSLGVDWAEPEDVIITGSIANYNWNKKYSDIDLHILVDYEDVDERVDFVRDFFTLKKNEWNQKHKNLRIFGFPVEVYVQDANEPHASSGVYSIDKDKWLTEPDLDNLRSGKVNKKHIREMVSTYMNKIDCLIDIYKKHKDDEYEMEKVAKDAAEMFDEIKKMRKDDLGKYGREMCDGNIIFKALRRSDYIGKLLKLRDLTYDKINSL